MLVNDRRVLIAEDDEDILLLITTRLARDGFEIASARSGTDALATVGSWRPHAVILDVTLPGLDGLDVLRRIRADEELKGMTVILLTSNAQERDMRRGYEAGADDYVVKPFSPAELSVRLRAMLDGR